MDNMIKIKDHHHHHHHQQDDIIHDHQLSKLKAISPPKLAPPSPPSNASSPSHEFSFTISLHPNSTAADATATAAAAPDKSKPTHDFSPADEIFFQGHLLPLHLLSHLTPISPRASINSLDHSLTQLPAVNQTKTNAAAASSNDIKERTKSKSFSYGHPRPSRNPPESKDKPTKSKSFSFLGIPKWRITEKKQSNNNQQNQKTKMKFDVIGNVVKRYIRMIKPLILSLRGKKEKSQLLRQPHSFSGNLAVGGSRKGGVTGRRDISSAPASMRTSPGNSGLLAPAPLSSTSDSTMEELQAAIQAAIAHCKNSISKEEKNIKAK